MKLKIEVEQWPYRAPFRITGFTWDEASVIVVTLEDRGFKGRGEAAGVHYLGDNVQRMLSQLESVRAAVEAGVDRKSLIDLLPAGGASNALDCALWDMEAKMSGRPVWQLAALESPRALLTTFTCVADTPEEMAACARRYAEAQALKLKLTGSAMDGDRVRAVRESRPNVWLSVDANQGFTRSHLETLMPILVESKVALVEQPFPIGEESWLDGFDSPIPIAADESVRISTDLVSLIGRFNVVNIKLDKCGGLTEGLALARACRAIGLTPMVGCMGGTSLAMAPAFLVGQLCDIVDLDGPSFLRQDRPGGVQYSNGSIVCTESMWGGVDAT